MDSEKLEGVRRHVSAAELLRPFAVRVENVFGSASDGFFENVILLLVVEKLRHFERRAAIRTATVHVMNIKCDHALRVRIGKRIEKHVLNHAKDRGRGSNSQRESQHRE